MRIFSYSTMDGKIFVYDSFEESAIQVIAEDLKTEIFFELSDEEASELTEALEFTSDNLKNDFIWYKPKINGQSSMVCTCGEFEEFGENSDRGRTKIAKAALRHHKKTGHTLNPRGN